MKQLIIDTDGNLEALEAIRIALDDKDVCVKAITTVASGLTVEEAVSNVLQTLNTLNQTNISVYKGLAKPMLPPPRPLKLNTHSRLQNDLLETPNRESAVNAIIKAVESGDTEIITMGPLTNIALAFAKNRKVMLNVKKITMLAGMIFHGDVEPMSEYNFYMDSYSADFLLKTGVDITILPIKVGSYRERMKYALHPERITRKHDSYTRIEVNGELTYGANINDVRDRSRKEFVSQNSVLYPFNCTLVADNCKEEITMEV